MAANARGAPPLISGSLRKERVLHGVSMGFGDRFCVVEAGLLSWHATQEHAQVSSQPPVGTMALDRWTVISDLKHARSGAPVSKHKVVQPSASWRLRRLLSAPDITPLVCPRLRTAPANQPLSPRWPAISGLFSTCRRARVGLPHRPPLAQRGRSQAEAGAGRRVRRADRGVGGRAVQGGRRRR